MTCAFGGSYMSKQMVAPVVPRAPGTACIVTVLIWLLEVKACIGLPPCTATTEYAAGERAVVDCSSLTLTWWLPEKAYIVEAVTAWFHGTHGLGSLRLG